MECALLLQASSLKMKSALGLLTVVACLSLVSSLTLGLFLRERLLLSPTLENETLNTTCKLATFQLSCVV